MVYSHQLQATHCRQEPAWKGIWTDRKGNGWYVEARAGTMLEPDQRAGRELLSGPCWVPPCESSLSQDPVCRARGRDEAARHETARMRRL